MNFESRYKKNDEKFNKAEYKKKHDEKIAQNTPFLPLIAGSMTGTGTRKGPPGPHGGPSGASSNAASPSSKA